MNDEQAAATVQPPRRVHPKAVGNVASNKTHQSTATPSMSMSPAGPLKPFVADGEEVRPQPMQPAQAPAQRVEFDESTLPAVGIGAGCAFYPNGNWKQTALPARVIGRTDDGRLSLQIYAAPESIIRHGIPWIGDPRYAGRVSGGAYETSEQEARNYLEARAAEKERRRKQDAAYEEMEAKRAARREREKGTVLKMYQEGVSRIDIAEQLGAAWSFERVTAVLRKMLPDDPRLRVGD